MIEAPDPRPAYTVTDWRVKPGAESEFVEEWTQFSEWLLEHGASSFALIKAPDDPGHYMSLGVWPGRGATAPWPSFLERLGRCRALCETTSSQTYRLAELRSRAGSRPSAALAV